YPRLLIGAAPRCPERHRSALRRTGVVRQLPPENGLLRSLPTEAAPAKAASRLGCEGSPVASQLDQPRGRHAAECRRDGQPPSIDARQGGNAVHAEPLGEGPTITTGQRPPAAAQEAQGMPPQDLPIALQPVSNREPSDRFDLSSQTCCKSR